MKTGQPARLQNLLARLPNAPSTDFTEALAREGVTRARNFIKGIELYRTHPAHRDVPEAPVIWRQGTTCLRDYGTDANAPALLVIPSLINRFDILDLDFAPSFLRTLAARGFRPLVVDWDVPGEDEKNFTVTDYVKRLVQIVEVLAPGTQPLHLLGYCMGGLLALALAALRPTQLNTLTLMATPWDFHQPDLSAAALFTALGAQIDRHVEPNGMLPVDILQGLFASLQPMLALEKFVEFAAMDPNGAEARRFVLLEDWLNDGVPLTANVARECLNGWYRDNAPALNNWRIDGMVVDPRKLDMPTYVVVPGKDHIVPPESALPLMKLLPHATLHEPMTGHIGMMASRNAPQHVWAPLMHWLGEHV